MERVSGQKQAYEGVVSVLICGVLGEFLDQLRLAYPSKSMDNKSTLSPQLRRRLLSLEAVLQCVENGLLAAKHGHRLKLSGTFRV
jgi:hypothetical protein